VLFDYMAQKRAQKAKKEAEKERPVHNTWGWIEWSRRSDILMCTCGNKYLKTRKGQKKCLRCVSRA
jgi:hypothetical protein